MGPHAPPVILSLHIALGFAGFLLGAAAIAARRFGRVARWHRPIGRAYAVSMTGVALLSIPLAVRAGSYFLLVIGVLTLGWVAGGWLAIRRALRSRRSGGPVFAALLRRHVVLMGSSYIGAWTAFLVNVRPLGSAPPLFWLYALGPTVVGSVLIARATARVMKAA